MSAKKKMSALLENNNNNTSQQTLANETTRFILSSNSTPTSTASSSSSTSLSPKWTAIAWNKHDFNKNNLEAHKAIAWRPNKNGMPHLTWRFLRRKQALCLLAIVLFILYMNSTTLLKSTATEERIPVLHYSHVPGMREVNQVVVTEMAKNSNETEQQHHASSLNNLTRIELIISNAISVTNTTFTSAIANNPTKAPQILHQTNSAFDTHAYEVLSATQNGNFSTMPILPPAGYLVWSERCKMPNLDPYLPEVMKYFTREQYEPCSSVKPLTQVRYNETQQRYILEIIAENMHAYSKYEKLNCCYQTILRNATGVNADEHVSLSDCVPFKQTVELASTIDNILVSCRDKKKQVYINGHPMMPQRKDIQQRQQVWAQKTDNINTSKPKELRAPSVLMIGIDSISRINLIRAMPKTAQHLYDNDWFEMSGYNKINDNTFPNLMAILTGMNQTTAFQKCTPTVLNALDNCSFIWNTFREHGYVTAYAEDAASINTFNYLKVGFERPPADYYLRPFLLSAEKHLHIKRKSNLIYCLGYQHSAAYVYDYALELARRYKHKPFFGLFWTNTFSHNAISDCSSMDGFVLNYLQQFATMGTLNNTIVIFFSDHGMRFGPTRKSLSGHLEERLPFMFIWLPPQLKQQHPEFVNALSVNKNRLTNPYDIHMTLKHVLQMTGRVQQPKFLQQAENCANCQTLLRPVPQNRSCAEIAIEDHWCTCIPYQNIYKNSKLIRKLAGKAVSYINEYVVNFRNGSFAKLCVPLQLANIEYAYHAQFPSSEATSNLTRAETMETYRIVFYTKPNKALFEATVRYNDKSDSFGVTGEISRLNSYNTDAECVGDGGAKKYCSCRKRKPL